MRDQDPGSRIYSDDQKRRVIAFLEQHRGAENPTTTGEIEAACQIKERALRQLVSDLDGQVVDGWPLVLAYDETHRHLWLATSREEALSTTSRLRHQAYHMNVRCDRREQAYRLLGEAQGALL